jgi:hypothetical protein
MMPFGEAVAALPDHALEGSGGNSQGMPRGQGLITNKVTCRGGAAFAP